MSLSSRLVVAAVSTLTSVLDLATGTVPLNYTKSLPLGNGTGANAADLIWHDRRTIAGSGTDDLDLAGGLVDAFGTVLGFARVRAMIVAAAAANANVIRVGNAASNPWATWINFSTSYVPVRPGGVFTTIAPDATGFPVTAGTGDMLRVTNTGAGDVTYDIILIGASA